ncbi:MAG: alpha/beta hydrolase [Lachnospiraceae bacterium]|nr:alpha/beta hydrolase [Lachnospiraceae bacterium]
MKLLMLYGVNCTKDIWNEFSPYLKKYEVDYVEYPHEVTEKANRVDDITKWVYDTYHGQSYDAVIGHSLGGIIALQLASEYNMNFRKIIFLDTNLKPANEFYRNLMTPGHMEQYGKDILPMFQEERKYYTQALFEQLQGEFDYTYYLNNINEKVYGVYGDRNMPEYKNKMEDLNLSDETLGRLELKFISNACHMIMIENPHDLFFTLEPILEN